MTRHRPPYPRPQEEWFEFIDLGFNITFALESVIGARRPVGFVAAIALLPKAEIREKHLASARVQRLDPVILATLPSPFGVTSIDGHHRAAYAHRKGVLWLKAHLLDEEETRECCFTRASLLRLKREAAHHYGKAVLAELMGTNIQIVKSIPQRRGRK